MPPVLRRVNLSFVVFFLICACAHEKTRPQFPQSAAKKQLPGERIPLLQGLTTETSTQISALVPIKDEPSFRLREEGTNRQVEAEITGRATRTDSPWQALKVRFTGLRAERTYRLEVVTPTGIVRDSRLLRPFRLQASDTFKFALVSCMYDGYGELMQRIWTELFSHRPQMVFLIGDNVYVDAGMPRSSPKSPSLIWRRYVETRRSLPLFYQDELTPTLATWDDHDTGLGDSDASFPYMKEAAEIFRAFYAQDAEHSKDAQDAEENVVTSGPGLAYEFRVAKQRFFFLDDRSFRSPDLNARAAAEGIQQSGSSASETQAHFGPQQEAWLLKRLAASPQPAWLISGGQFFGGYHPFESYEGSHPKAFARFVDALRGIQVPYVLASGDRHLTEIMTIDKANFGFPTFEITSSGIHARVFPGSFVENPNPRQLVGRDGINNYMIVTSRAKDIKNLEIHTVSYAPGNETLFTKDLKVQR